MINIIALKSTELLLVNGGITTQVCSGYSEGRMFNDKSSCFIDNNEVTVTWFDPDTNLYVSTTKNYTCKEGSNVLFISYNNDEWIEIGTKNKRICVFNNPDACLTHAWCKK